MTNQRWAGFWSGFRTGLLHALDTVAFGVFLGMGLVLGASAMLTVLS